MIQKHGRFINSLTFLTYCNGHVFLSSTKFPITLSAYLRRPHIVLVMAEHARFKADRARSAGYTRQRDRVVSHELAFIVILHGNTYNYSFTVSMFNIKVSK